LRAFYVGQKPDSALASDAFSGKMYYVRYFIDL
jgi:hypothetical protein